MIEESNLKVTPKTKIDFGDLAQEKSRNILRPLSLTDFVGQRDIVEQVEIMIGSAKKRKANCDHLLFYGFPGLGKTSISQVIANELGVNMHLSSGQAISKPGDMAAILSNLSENDILFIDEIHRLKPNVEEILYTAMEDFVIDIVLGNGPTAKSMRLDIPQFTLVGATTMLDKLSTPFRDRFGAVLKLKPYNTDELAVILQNNCKRLSIDLSKEAMLRIADVSRGTPRVANNILKRVRDYAEYHSLKSLSINHISEVLSKLGINNMGLDQTDINLIRMMYSSFGNGPVGLKTLAAASNEPVDSIENIHEPYLIQLGLIQRTHRGRLLTDKGVKFASSLDNI